MKTNFKKRLGLFRDPNLTKYIQTLDAQKDACELVFLMTSYSFHTDIKRALELALFRTFASPAVSGLLHRTGEFRKRGQRRYDDTALLIFAFMQTGYDSVEGKFAIEHMNKIHGHYVIDNNDFLYVLSTFIFEPINWIEEFGWRKLFENEKEALFEFFRAVGIRMGGTDIPKSLDAYREWMENYEATHFVYAESNAKVAEATINIVKGWLPKFLHFGVKPTMVALMDKRLRDAIGYKPSPRWYAALIRAVLWARKYCLKLFVIGKYPTTLKNVYARSYPKGFDLADLGPPAMVAQFKKENKSKK